MWELTSHGQKSCHRLVENLMPKVVREYCDGLPTSYRDGTAVDGSIPQALKTTQVAVESATMLLSRFTFR